MSHTDLVNRLRWATSHLDLTKNLTAAADRIEKLEVALRKMLMECMWNKREKWCGTVGCHCQTARKALEGKND
jgi:hypothetical protein